MTLPEGERKLDKREKPLTKVIVRRLPPNMDQTTFLNQVSPIPDYNYIYTVKGDSNLGEFSFSRVYINFVNPEDVYSFKERFDNYVFLDSKGHEYPAVVEFAPFQKIPKKRGKIRTDPKCGTIESDPAFIQFIESLNKPKETVDEKPEYSLQLLIDKKSESDITTPLLEFIKNKRAQRMKIREIRREERKRKEFDRRKDRFDERKKSMDDRSPIKKDKLSVDEKPTESGDHYKEEKAYDKSYCRGKERRYDDHRKYEDKRKEIKPRYPKKEYVDHKETREKDHKSKYDNYKKEETKVFPKKVKKYSEKREERKIEAQRAEQEKLTSSKSIDVKDLSETSCQSAESEVKITTNLSTEDKPSTPEKSDTCKEESPKLKQKSQQTSKEVVPEYSKEEEDREANKECGSQPQRRIRNKDRPTIAIYRPGMLSKRRQTENGSGDKNSTKDGSKSDQDSKKLELDSKKDDQDSQSSEKSEQCSAKHLQDTTISDQESKE